MTNTNSKFVATLTEVNKDTDIIAEDVRTMFDVDTFLDEVIDRNDKEVVYVVGERMDTAQNIADLLNARYTKEMELMENVKPVIKEEELTTATTEDKAAAKIAKSDAAQKFLARHNKQVESKEEVEMKVEDKKEVKGATRRRLNTAAKPEGEYSEPAYNEYAKEAKKPLQNNTNQKVETEMNKPNRKSTTRVLKSEDKKQAVANGRRRLGRSESIKNEFKKFEGPWYLNTELYPVLNRLEDVLETLSDAELGIEQIVLVNPDEVSRTRNNPDITVVIQIKANGNILEFPIKEASANSSSDLASTSIGWVDTKNGMRPAFGFWRPNEINVKATCTCGKEFKANTGNVYCHNCKKKHAQADVSVSHALDMEFDGNWTFQTVPNLVVPRETLALVMAIAQYDAGFDMWGVVAE